MTVGRIFATWLALVTFGRAAEPDAASVIRSAPLVAARPYFIPTHPRVTTTIRFPHEISAPDGSVAVFSEDAEKSGNAEYLVTWQQGDAYFTLTPLKEARMANLNVPYQGHTYVFYFYPVVDPLGAVASLTLDEGAAAPPAAEQLPNTESPHPAPPIDVSRETDLPIAPPVPVTPARLLGLIDRLKVVHATPPGPQLAALVSAMELDVAISREERGNRAESPNENAASEGVAGEIPRGTNDFGWFQIILLRAVRDRRLNCVGFVCLLRNTSEHILAFDVNSFGARVGAMYLMQRISDAVPILKPREQAPIYFAIQAPRGAPLLATNAWRLSVDLLSPRINPGAAITRGFSPSAP